MPRAATLLAVGFDEAICRDDFSSRYYSPRLSIRNRSNRRPVTFFLGLDVYLGEAFFWSCAMGMKLYVGNLSYETSSSDLETLFAEHGQVRSAQVIMDRDTGRSKGFGFVEMADSHSGQAAMQALNEREHNGRRLTVNEARPREERGGGGGGGGGGRRRF